MGLYEKLKIYFKKYKLLRKYLQLKKQAQSLAHLTILLNKMIRNMPIDKDETQIKSYNDLKKSFCDQWPFMWEVNNTRNNKITVGNKYLCETFSSYSYLDFARDPEIQNAAIEAAKMYSSGNHGPRMLGGNTSILVETEKEIAKFLGKQRSITCSSGYLAVMSTVASLAQKGDVIFADQYCHASLRSGFTLSGAEIVFFKHNNFKDCEEKIKKYSSKVKKLLVMESVYSMDGNIGDLPKAKSLCQKYNMYLIVDEAHGLGALGKTGRGLEEHYNMPGAIDVICGTFSKSLASVGGFIAGNDDIITYMEFFAQGNMFSAPCSAYHAGAALASLKKIQQNPEIVQKLMDNVKYFRNKLATAVWKKDFDSNLKFEVYGMEGQAIIPIIFKEDALRMIQICNKLKINGYITGCVLAPACPLKTPRLRITCNSNYTHEQIDKFVNTLVELTEQEPATQISEEFK